MSEGTNRHREPVIKSATPPASPYVGLEWKELSAGLPKYGWNWWWDGTYWRSPEQRWEMSIHIGTSIREYLSQFDDLNVYLKSLKTAFACSVTQNGTNNYVNSLERGPASGATTVIASLSTNGNAANNRVTQQVAINTHINVIGLGVKTLQVISTSNGSPGTITGGFTVFYDFARP